MMPFAMAVIMVLLFLFVSGLYLDITDPLLTSGSMKIGTVTQRRPTRQIHVGSVPSAAARRSRCSR